jgi:hypothetical protein
MNNQDFNDEKLREALGKVVTSQVSNIGKDLMQFRSNFQQSAQTIIDNVGQAVSFLEEELLRMFREEVSKAETGLRAQLEPEVRGLIETEVRQKVEEELKDQIHAAKMTSAEAEQQKFQSKLDVLNGALREISQQQTQVEILGSFLDKAAVFAPRVAFFVVKSGNIVGWQARGFEGEFRNDSIRSVVFPPDSDTFFKQIAESKTSFRGAVASHTGVSEVVAKFGPIAPDFVFAIPLIVRDKTVAILYADSGVTGSGTVDCHSLEILMTGVSLTVELSSARAKLGIKTPEAHQAQVTPGKEASVAIRAESPAPSLTATPVPPAVVEPALERVEPSVAPAGAPPESERPSDVRTEEPTVEAFKAPEPPESTPAPLSAPSTPVVSPVPSSFPLPPVESLGETDQKLHNDARRFARLLVSEIKLYNEQKVQQGRRDKNLYDVLRDDIDKSREMYDKRVSPEVASRVDYFYEELVRILADNQVQALGRECPGPTLVK